MSHSRRHQGGEFPAIKKKKEENKFQLPTDTFTCILLHPKFQALANDFLINYIVGLAF